MASTKQLFLGALALLALTSPVLAEDSVTVVSWGGAYQDAQRKVFFQPFEKATGIKLKEESWDGGIGTIRSRLSAGTDPGWDVVQVETSDILVGCEEGLFEKLDWAKLGGKDAYIPGAAQDCGVGAILVNEGIAYDKDKLKTAPKGWADFFDTKTFPGKRALRMNPTVAMTAALLGDGVPAADLTRVLSTKEGQDRAFAKLDTIKKDLVFWKAGAQPPQFLASGEVVMTTAYNGRIDAANRNDKRNFGFVWDGSVGTFDYWVVLHGTPRKEAAYKYLEFINQPQYQGMLPTEIAYGVSLKAAADKIDPKRLPDIPSAPQNLAVSVKQDLNFWLENNDRLTERLQSWASR